MDIDSFENEVTCIHGERLESYKQIRGIENSNSWKFVCLPRHWGR